MASAASKWEPCVIVTLAKVMVAGGLAGWWLVVDGWWQAA